MIKILKGIKFKGDKKGIYFDRNLMRTFIIDTHLKLRGWKAGNFRREKIHQSTPMSSAK